MSPFVMHLWATEAGAYPEVVSVSSGGTSALGQATITKPASLAEHNTMLLLFRNISATHDATGDGWTQVFSVNADGVNHRMSAWSKAVTSSESATFQFDASSANRTGWVVLQFQGGVTFSHATAVDSLDPPNLSILGDAEKTMWLACVSHGASDSTLTNPTDYTDQVRGASDSTSADTRSACACARQERDAASENPGTWAASATAHYPIAATVGVRVTP